MSQTHSRRRGPGERSDRRERLAIAGIVVLGAALRFYHLGQRSFNGGDEPFSLALAQRDLWHMLKLFGYEANGTLYSISLWPVSRIGESEALLRAPAALAGTAAVAAVWWAGRRMVSPRAALLGALLLALSPMAISYSQTARPFAYVMLFATISFGALARALDEGDKRWWALYALALAGAAYSNTLTAFVIPVAQAVMVVPRGRAEVRRWAIWLAVTGLALLPLAVAIVIERGRRDPLYWVARPHPGTIKETVDLFTGGASVAAVTVLVLLIAGALVAVAFARSEGSAARRALAAAAPGAVLAWALAPPILMILISFVTPVYQPQYAISALPGVTLLLAAWVDRAPRSVGAAALALLCAGALAGAVAQDRDSAPETWRSAVGWIEKHRRPGDRLLVDIPAVFTVFGYYDQHWAAPNGDLVVYEWGDRPFPRREVIPYDDPGGYGGIVGPPPARVIARNASGNRRLFVAFSEYVRRLQGDLPQGAALRFARRHCRVRQPSEVGLQLYLIDRCRR